jgi:uncharacterized protein YbcV (DUF1398 family)
MVVYKNFKLKNMKRKIVYVAADCLDLFEENDLEIFEEEQDVIEFCNSKNDENNESWGWRTANYYYRNK